jgi:tetratricopeptide (TPR) repeat protein
MRLILATVIIMFLVFPSFIFAETKEIISEGTYNMGDGETPSVAESRALLKAKQIALEQAGTYVESYSKVKNLTLTQDEIQVLASGLMEVEILDKKRTIVDDGINFWVKIKAKVNSDKMEEMAKRAKEKSVVEDYKRIQEAYAKSQEEIEELKEQLAEVKDAKRKKNVEVKIADEEKLFKANDWFGKGYDYGLKNEYDKALNAYSKALIVYPEYYPAYYNRGTVYLHKEQYAKAVEDFTRFISSVKSFLAPSYLAPAYNNRALAYFFQKRYERAIEDFDKGIELNPMNAKAYTMRGLIYRRKGQYDRAFNDFNKAIAIDPVMTEAYTGRGYVHLTKDQLDKAIDDFSRAISIEPDDTESYAGRGAAHYKSGQYNSAIDDFSKAIDLDPNNQNAYSLRGASYYEIGNFGEAISDLQKVCDMGDKGACNSVK